jgi:hypothetical protein
VRIASQAGAARSSVHDHNFGVHDPSESCSREIIPAFTRNNFRVHDASEYALSAELDSTRAILSDLNVRLNELEREITIPPASQGQPKKN